MRRRYAILEHDTLTVLGRGGVRRWPVTALATDPGAAARACAGATLVVESGTVQSAVLDTAAVPPADLRRYCHHAWLEHTRDGCGSLQRVGEVQLVQRIDGASGLSALMAWAAQRRVGFRRIRHGGQRAEVVYRCLRSPPAACVIGWEGDACRHLAVVVHGTLLWHRRLHRAVVLSDAMAETHAFVQERRLVTADTRVTRVWVGPSADGDGAEQVVDPDELARTLRLVPARNAAARRSPELPVLVLDSARSDLRNPAMRSSARWRAGAHCAALVSSIALGVLLSEAWRERAAIAPMAFGAPTEADNSGLGTYPAAVLTAVQRDRWRAVQAWEHRPGGDVTAWHGAMLSAARAVSALPLGTQLLAVDWVADPPAQHLQLVFAPPSRAGSRLPTLALFLSDVLQRQGWGENPSHPNGHGATQRDTAGGLTLSFSKALGERRE
ncbi:MAG: hypothetical protein AAGA11_11905 [Pseudomonadota bacterium]